MKYSLRSLMIVVTLVCVVLGGRIEYPRRWAVFHEQEAELSGSDVFKWDDHQFAAYQFRMAMWRPWTIVKEWEHYIDDPTIKSAVEMEDEKWAALVGKLPPAHTP